MPTYNIPLSNPPKTSGRENHKSVPNATAITYRINSTHQWQARERETEKQKKEPKKSKRQRDRE